MSILCRHRVASAGDIVHCFHTAVSNVGLLIFHTKLFFSCGFSKSSRCGRSWKEEAKAGLNIWHLKVFSFYIITK